MPAREKRWFKYTSESGVAYRIKADPDLAAIGGLSPVNADELPPLPETIKARYVWLHETTRPKDRLPARMKVIIEHDRLKDLWLKPHVRFEINGNILGCFSYFGEVVSLSK